VRRFSDAAARTMPTTRSGRRRPKSAKARNRGGLGTEGAAECWRISCKHKLPQSPGAYRPALTPKELAQLPRVRQLLVPRSHVRGVEFPAL
jgi:hypothetical protein